MTPGRVPFGELPAAERARLVDELLRPFTTLGKPTHPPDEQERVGRELYQRLVVPRLTPADDGRFVALDTRTGEFEIDDDAFAASRRLAIHAPGAVLWETRVGYVLTGVVRPAWRRA